jgi:peptide/nickel transport system permease protein
MTQPDQVATKDLRKPRATLLRFGTTRIFPGGRKQAQLATPAALQGTAPGHHPVLVAIARRLAVSAPLLFVVSALVFILTSVIPGDATEVVLGPKATSSYPLSAYVRVKHELGLDRSLPEQYWTWLTHAFHGNLGDSLVTSQSITAAISQAFPVTLSLVAGAIALSVPIGVGLGVLSAVRGGAIGRTVDVVAMVGWVMPVYWLAAEFVVIFAVILGWLPALGYVPLSQSPTEWLRSLILPISALALGPIGGFAKFTREAMLDALGSEYVRLARANGISTVSIIFRHALKTASLQVVTFAGLLIVGLVIGSVFVEKVFALQGIGSLMVNGANQHDLPMVQGVAVFYTLIVFGVNLAIDLAYALLNPKVRAV